MENTIQDQLAHQQEMLRDLQAQLADATDEEKKKSLRLKMNVTNAKIAELQSKQSSEPVNEETPEEVEELEIETPEEQLDEAYSHKEEIKKLSDHIKTLKGSVDKIEQACKKENWFDIIDKIEDTESLIDMLKFHYNNVYNASKNKTLTESIVQDKARWDDAVKFGKSHGHPAPKLSLGQKTSKGEVVGVMYGRLSSTPIYSVSKDGGKTFKDYYEEELMEGCMTKKFENMSNREIASYIFSHPHTKFAGKMKECDDKEIMKAIRAMKKTEEEAPVTNTSAVATTEVPSMFMKKKLK